MSALTRLRNRVDSDFSTFTDLPTSTDYLMKYVTMLAEQLDLALDYRKLKETKDTDHRACKLFMLYSLYLQHEEDWLYNSSILASISETIYSGFANMFTNTSDLMFAHELTQNEERMARSALICYINWLKRETAKVGGNK